MKQIFEVGNLKSNGPFTKTLSIYQGNLPLIQRREKRSLAQLNKN